MPNWKMSSLNFVFGLLKFSSKIPASQQLNSLCSPASLKQAAVCRGAVFQSGFLRAFLSSKDGRKLIQCDVEMLT